MKSLDLATYGVAEMKEVEMTNVQGSGWDDAGWDAWGAMFHELALLGW